MSLNAVGCFAYSFNIFASQSTNNPWYFVEYPLWTIAFLLIAGYLSILACRLLLMTAHLHYSNANNQPILLLNHDEREGVPSLPWLLDQSAPQTRTGRLLNFVFLLLVMVMLFRFSLYWSLRLAVHLDPLYQWHGALGNAVMILLLLGCAFSFYRLQYFQIGCVLCYILLPLSQPEKKLNLDWLQEAPILFAMFVQLFSNQLYIPSIATKAPKFQPKRQTEFLKWAVGLIIAEYLLTGLIFKFYGDISEGSWGEKVFPVVMVLCDVSCVHIRVMTLADVIISWYGVLSPEVHRRAQNFSFFIVAGLIFEVFWFKPANLTAPLLEPPSFLLFSSVLLIVIPYCYNNTVERMMEQVEFRVAPKWWSYALYAGGVFSLMGYLSCFFLPGSKKMIYSLFADLIIAAELLLFVYLQRRCCPQ